ncbi:3-oxoacyl-ACP synthase [Paraburkholderia kururiensis]|uniref:3-oxoacyl-ACP synthase n=1 Tax=Paraburkholderia kururiensis TaxID=984307 RepID=UPI0039A73CBD
MPDVSTPVITAMATCVPRAASLARWRTIEAALSMHAPSGWNAWVASWWPDFAPCLDNAAIAGNVRHTIREVHGARAVQVPVARDTDLSGLAARVTQAICLARGRDAPPIDIVMFCHSSPEEHVSTTTAGRLRAVVGAPCFPFSVSQQHGASPFTALQLARDLLIAEGDVQTILIVAAEKWCPPFSRATAWGIVQGDAAGALLVERLTGVPHGLALIGASTHRLRHCATGATAARDGISTDWIAALLATIDALLDRHNLRPRDIAAVVGQAVDTRLDTAVRRHLGFAPTARYGGACLGAAEPVVQLATALAGRTLPQDSRIVVWGIGLDSYIGTALFAFHDMPLLSCGAGACAPS